jgi:hypothetical protein
MLSGVPIWLHRLLLRARTTFRLLRFFVARERFFMAPLLLVLFAAGVLLAATSGVAKIAPFVYTLF